MRITCPQNFTVADLILLLKGADVSAPIIFHTQWGANLQIKNLQVQPNGNIVILMQDEREDEINELAKTLATNLAIDVMLPPRLDN